MPQFSFLPHENISRPEELPQLTTLASNSPSGTWYLPYHSHKQDLEINFFLSGSGAYNIEGTSIPVTEGDILYIRSGVLHSCFSSSQNPLNLITLNFRLPHYLEQISYCCENMGAYTDYARQTMITLYQLTEKEGTSSCGIVQNMLYALLKLIERLLLQGENTTVLDKPGMELDILHYLFEHSAENITLTTLSETFHVSASHISYIFSRHFGISPINYLIDVRFYKARALITSTDMPLVQVAEEIGYENYNHFHHLFIKRIGMTPLEFRSRYSRRDIGNDPLV